MDPIHGNLAIVVPIAVVVVLVIGAVVGFVTMTASKKRGGAVLRWAHGAYSLWTGGEDSASWQPERAQNAFRDWYGARAGGTAQNVIDDLIRGQTGNAAWDLVRALDLVRMGVAAGYLDADQCRERCARIGKQLQAQYGGWDALAVAFEQGMQAWQRGRGVTDPNELGRVQRNLPKLRAEVWPAIPYDTALSEE